TGAPERRLADPRLAFEHQRGGRLPRFVDERGDGGEHLLAADDLGGHGVPRAAQASAETVNGAAGNLSRHRSRSRACRVKASRATNAPAGPTPSVNGSHHSSNVGCSTSTEIAASSISRNPAAAKSSVR